MKSTKRIIMRITLMMLLLGFTAGMAGVCSSNTVRAESKRAKVMMKRYKSLTKKCKKKYKYNGSQLEMNQDSYKEYTVWDKELNRVYQEVRKHLSDGSKKKLKKSQLKWIKKRDKAAKTATTEWKGGSAETMIYNVALTKETKKRIRYLIKNYA